MPSASVSPVTLPNNVSTPTFPVGIEVVLHHNSNKITIASAIRRNLEPANRKFGIAGIEPPKSIVLRGGFPICLLRPAAFHSHRAHRCLSSTTYCQILCFSRGLASKVPTFASCWETKLEEDGAAIYWK